MAFIKLQTLFVYLCSALEEETGWLSIMRIGFIIVILTGCGIAIYFAVRGHVTKSEVALVIGLISVALGGKAWQKKYEKIRNS